MKDISKTHDVFIYIIVLTCFAMAHYDGAGYAYGSTYQRFIYMFAHANILHLAMNLIAYFSISQMVKGTAMQYTPFLAAFLATFGTECDIPTVGLSGVIYAMLATTTYYFEQSRWRILSFAVVANGLYYLIGSVNVGLHVLSFAYSLIFTLIYDLYERRKNSNIQGRVRVF